jgi:hypothetical protein
MGPRPTNLDQVPDSQASTQLWDSRIGPRPSESPPLDYDSQINTPQTPRRQLNPLLTRSDRIRIKTALDFNILFYKIQDKYGFTINQIRTARDAPRLTPQRNRCGRKPKITTPKRRQLEA